jgi:putative N6-adenine-specific DNA methylase
VPISPKTFPIDLTVPRPILITCGLGSAPALANELRALGQTPTVERESGVEIRGTLRDAMSLNLLLRTGNRVLAELGRQHGVTAEALYQFAGSFPWESILPPDGYFTVASYVNTPSMRDTRFVNVRCKDAIVDRIRGLTGKRPNSGNERSGAVVFVYWNGSDLRLYLDTSGESLSRRGYRKIPMEAPMQETLAAAVVLATGWTGETPFVNPMCGSGTLAIEAALIATGRPPGLLRQDFAFRHLQGFDEAQWKEVRAEAQRRPLRKPPAAIIASDIRREAVEAARRNARTAGVEQLIEFHVCDFAETPLPPEPGILILNPEYGERMSQGEDLGPLYHHIGDFFKKDCQGWQGYVFTGNLAWGKQIGLRTCSKQTFFNSRIECKLLGFRLYAGSVRSKHAASPDAGTAPDAP